jgi:hypothetical protein
MPRIITAVYAMNDSRKLQLATFTTKNYLKDRTQKLRVVVVHVVVSVVVHVVVTCEDTG